MTVSARDALARAIEQLDLADMAVGERQVRTAVERVAVAAGWLGVAYGIAHIGPPTPKENP